MPTSLPHPQPIKPLLAMEPVPAPIPHLPSEIWLMILESLPPSFFQHDIRRLALSKRWYSLAFPAFYPRIEFTPRVISRLVHRKSASLDRSRALLRKSLRCVTIVLDGLGGTSEGGNPDVAAVFDTPANLARFSLMLLECRELKEVRFAARWPNPAWRADPLQRDYLPLRSLEPYLGLLTTHVTALDLDLCGTDVLPDGSTGSSNSPGHFCEHVRPLLSRLRTLRLRMRSICHMALWPLEGAPAVTLGELTLSLYLGRVSENNPKLNSSRTCRYWGAGALTVPMDEMRARMRALVKDMVAPRRAEMVHLAPSGEVHVWDASTGDCVRDWSEKPMELPLCFEKEFKRSCFSKHADDWEFDDDVGIGGIFTSYPDEASDDDQPYESEEMDEPEELDEPAEVDEPEEPDELEGVGGADEASVVDVDDDGVV